MPAPPNILLIVADDMGYGDFGIFSDGSLRTPALDCLVAEGLCLTQHYSASPVCAPARAGLLTGRYPHRTGALSVMEVRGQDRLALDERTLADALASAGYATGLIGKWHLGAFDRRYHPNARGFAEFAGFRGGWSDYFDWVLDYNGRPQRGDGAYLTDVLTAEAISYLRRHRREPFFLHLAYNAPHSPLQAPEADIAPLLASGRLSRPVATIYAMIQRMDRGIGRVLDALQQLGLAENTLVMFTSDNGPRFTESSSDVDTRRWNCGYRGAKGWVYEGGIRVPMVLRWPAGLPGAGEARGYIGGMVHFVDWLPTLLAAAGVAPRARGLPLDGRNVLPLLRGEPGEWPAVRYWQWNHYGPVGACNAAMRDGPWKLVRPRIDEALRTDPADWERDRAAKRDPFGFPGIYDAPEPDRTIPSPLPPELYRVDDDPGEEHDLAAQHPERAARMLRALETWFEEVNADRRRRTAPEGRAHR